MSGCSPLATISLVLGLRFVLPAPLGAQASSAKLACPRDSAFAEVYRAELERMHREQVPTARIQWSPPTAELCAAAQRTLVADSSAALADEILFVYTTTGIDPIRYAVLNYSAQRKRFSEWPAAVCFFDERWKPRGACLVM